VFLESRPYDIGCNSLEDCCYLLVLLVLLRLNSFIPPFKKGKRSGKGFAIQLLKCFLIFSLIIEQKERLVIIRMNLHLRDFFIQG